MPYVSPYYETCCGDDDEHAEHVSRRTARDYANGVKNIPDVKICKFISLNDLNRALSNWLPRPGDPEARRAVIRNSMFQPISEILIQYGKGEWSLRPRLFSLLRMLDCMDLLDCFVREGIMDSALPFTQSTLPNFVVGNSLRSKLLALQKIVLYKKEDELIALEEGGKHVYLGGNGDDYFHSIHNLGSGGSAYVDHVFSRRTGKRFARKRVYRGQSPLQDEKVLQQFERELQALKRLHHRHIVTLKGSYTDPNCIALIMTPVAEMNLKEYFVDAKVDNNLRYRSLRCFFGCLATALAYLHEQNVRHNDIKPQNILVAKGSVYLTDFGTSRAWNTEEKSETRGKSEGYTPRYSAPETHDTGTRTRAADIFSLGCVFLDMATILHGQSIEEMTNFFEDNGSMRSDAIWANLAATRLWLESLGQTKSGLGPDVVKLISEMLRRDPEERPTAAQVRGRLMDSSGADVLICPHCSSPGGMLPTQQVLAESRSRDKEFNNDKATLEVEAGESSKPVTAAYLNLPERSAKVKAEALPPPELAATTDTSVTAVQVSDSRPQPVSPPAHQVSSSTPKSVRFGALPEDRRPVPIEPTIELEQSEQEAFIRPEHVKPPPFRQHDIHPLPSATLLPSYILAGTNHFQQAEIAVAARSNPSESNLFVYGRLMFPTVLHSLAVASQKGVYSQELRRRLHPSSADWAKADLSIKHTTQIMTPACLKGYDRWKPKGLNCAVLQDARLTKKILERQRDMGIEPAVAEPSGQVVGFLVLGVRSDALRFCDLVFGGNRKTLRKMKMQTDDKLETKPALNLLHRRSVDVEVELGDGKLATVNAQTYFWTGGVNDLDGVWEEDRFLRSSAVQSLLKDNPPWLEQERTLATAMQVSMALVGDYLCGAISAGSIQDLAVLLRNGFDPNAPCRIYGFPLQAAVSLGREDMARLLLDHGATVNSSGGQFGTPLIAAAYGSRKSIMKLLLHREADVFASDKVHVDALFQAVAHNDYAAAELLLEHGAWLSNAWKEVTDVAEELPDDEIRTLLGQYDVKKKRLEYLERRADRDDPDIDDQLTSIVPAALPGGDAVVQLLSQIRLSRVGSAVLLKFPRAAKMSGSWRGRRGVALTMAALNAGAPVELLLEAIRQMVHPVRVMRRILTQYDQERDLAGGSAHSGLSTTTQRAGGDGWAKLKDDYDSADDDGSDDDAFSTSSESQDSSRADSPQPSPSSPRPRPSMASVSSGGSSRRRAPPPSSPTHRNPRRRRSRSRSPDPRRHRPSHLEVPRTHRNGERRGQHNNEVRYDYQRREKGYIRSGGIRIDI